MLSCLVVRIGFSIVIFFICDKKLINYFIECIWLLYFSSVDGVRKIKRLFDGRVFFSLFFVMLVF